MTKLRQIPTSKEFNKKSIDDVLYTFFQINSYIGFTQYGEHIRFVYKNNYTNQQLANLLSCSVSQAQRKIKMLKDAGFITEDIITSEDGNDLYKVYVLTEFATKIQYIPVNVLQKLVDTTNKNVIKVYAYLLGWYEHKRLQRTNAFVFTKKQLITHCLGLSSTTNQRDYDTINNILECLVLFGLIEYKNIICNSPNDHQHIRMKLTKVNRKIKDVHIKTVAK